MWKTALSFFFRIYEKLPVFSILKAFFFTQNVVPAFFLSPNRPNIKFLLRPAGIRRN